MRRSRIDRHACFWARAPLRRARAARVFWRRGDTGCPPISFTARRRSQPWGGRANITEVIGRLLLVAWWRSLLVAWWRSQPWGSRANITEVVCWQVMHHHHSSHLRLLWKVLIHYYSSHPRLLLLCCASRLPPQDVTTRMPTRSAATARCGRELLQIVRPGNCEHHRW